MDKFNDLGLKPSTSDSCPVLTPWHSQAFERYQFQNFSEISEDTVSMIIGIRVGGDNRLREVPSAVEKIWRKIFGDK